MSIGRISSRLRPTPAETLLLRALDARRRLRMPPSDRRLGGNANGLSGVR